MRPTLTRNSERPGTSWLLGQTAFGHSNRLGLFHGFWVLLAVVLMDVTTGFDYTTAREQNVALTDTFLG